MSNSTTSAAPPDLVTLRQFVLSSGGNTTLLVVRLTATLSPDDRERFHRRHGSKNALKRQRLAERREAVRDLVRFYPTLASGHQIAAAIECDLAIVVVDASTTIAGDHLSALRRVLDLSRGDPPGFETIRKSLAGKDDETI